MGDSQRINGQRKTAPNFLTCSSTSVPHARRTNHAPCTVKTPSPFHAAITRGTTQSIPPSLQFRAEQRTRRCVLCGTQFGHAYYTRRMTVRSRCRYIILSTAEFFISCQDDKTGGISTRVRLFNLRGRIRIGMRWIRACPMGTPGAFHYYILHHTLYNTEDIRDTDT